MGIIRIMTLLGVFSMTNITLIWRLWQERKSFLVTRLSWREFSVTRSIANWSLGWTTTTTERIAATCAMWSSGLVDVPLLVNQMTQMICIPTSQLMKPERIPVVHWHGFDFSSSQHFAGTVSRTHGCRAWTTHDYKDCRSGDFHPDSWAVSDVSGDWFFPWPFLGINIFYNSDKTWDCLRLFVIDHYDGVWKFNISLQYSLGKNHLPTWDHFHLDVFTKKKKRELRPGK